MMAAQQDGDGVDVSGAIDWPDGAGPLVAGQPVVALDFDGVLNITVPGGRDRQPPHGFTRRMVELDRAHWPDHPYIRPLPPGDFPLHHAIVTSEVHREWISQWTASGAAVVWATTWELAIRGPEQLCGIPALPVLQMSAIPLKEYPQRTAIWKLRTLSQALAGHPMVWVDDFAVDWEGESQFGEPPMPLLAVAPDERVGLTEEQSQRVLEFVSRFTAAAAGG